MSQTVAALLEAVLALPEDARMEFVSALLASVEESGQRPFDNSWLIEVRRRSDEFDSGAVRSISWNEVKKQTTREVC
jgi:putative addiction module component (TIGR02574 family)